MENFKNITVRIETKLNFRQKFDNFPSFNDYQFLFHSGSYVRMIMINSLRDNNAGFQNQFTISSLVMNLAPNFQ